MKGKELILLYDTLRERFGFRNWWPADTKDEIVAGAILTQQTSWKNVELAIANLKGERMMTLERISGANIRVLQRVIRSSGFYRQKAARLKGVAKHIVEQGGVSALALKDKAELRDELLSLNGIGPETADAIALYVAGKPIFVIDAYTKRIMNRVFGTPKDIDYADLQSLMECNIPCDPALYRDFHAQLVELGKRHCRTKPLCAECPAKAMCAYYGMTTKTSRRRIAKAGLKSRRANA